MDPVKPHSLGKCLFLHLAPGVANMAAILLGFATLWNPSLPPELIFGVFANVFVLIPVQLGYLYYRAKKRGNPGWSLEGIVVYNQPVSWFRYLLWVPAILVPTAIIFAMFEPFTRWLEASLVGASVFAKYRTARWAFFRSSTQRSTRTASARAQSRTAWSIWRTSPIPYRGVLGARECSVVICGWLGSCVDLDDSHGGRS